MRQTKTATDTESAVAAPLSLQTVPILHQVLAIALALFTALVVYLPAEFLAESMFPGTTDRDSFLGWLRAVAFPNIVLFPILYPSVLLVWGLPAFALLHAVLKWFRGGFFVTLFAGTICGLMGVLVTSGLHSSEFLDLVVSETRQVRILRLFTIGEICGASGAIVAWSYIWLMRRRGALLVPIAALPQRIGAIAAWVGAVAQCVLLIAPLVIHQGAQSDAAPLPATKETEIASITPPVAEMAGNVPSQSLPQEQGTPPLKIDAETDSRFQYLRPLSGVAVYILGGENRRLTSTYDEIALYLQPDPALYPSPASMSVFRDNANPAVAIIRIDGQKFLGSTPYVVCISRSASSAIPVDIPSGDRCALESPLNDSTSVRVTFSDDRFPADEWPALLASLENGIRQIALP